MIAAAAPTRRLRLARPSVRWIAAGVAVALAVAAAFMFVTSPSGDTGADERMQRQAEQLRTYRDAIKPLTDEGATVVLLGLQPGVTDIAEGIYPSDVLLTMAEGWVASLENVRSGFDEVVPPSFLADTHWMYLRAIDGYVQAATALRLATGAEGEQRAQLVELASSLGRSADEIYDRAEAEVEADASRLGVTTSTEE